MDASIKHSEKELLDKISGQDQYAFKLIFDAYRPQVYTFALKHLKSSLQAEEAVQEVFLKLWRLEDRLKEVRDLENFLLTLTKNKSLDMLRRMKLEAKNFGEMPEDYEGESNDTEDLVLLNETRRILDKGVTLLPKQQQLVYELRNQQGLDMEQIAKKLDISPITAQRHLNMALTFLRTYVRNHTDVAAIIIILKLL